jgi:transcriptional regulator with XRE-family HTH domain
MSPPHAELAGFLRDRRGRLDPNHSGLPTWGRRRAPGLRREEVAQLASISTTWYTWLEQGRAVRPSRQVLDSLARALQLNSVEHEYLLSLCGYRETQAKPVRGAMIAPAHRAVLDAFGATPAHLTNRRLDVLAANAAMRDLLIDFTALPADERNVVWATFSHPVFRRRLIDWNLEADTLTAQLRLHFAEAGRDPSDDHLIARLCASSEEFRERWQAREVRRVQPRVKQFRLATGEIVRLETTSMNVADQADLRITVFTAADTESRRRLEAMHQRRSERAVVG